MVDRLSADQIYASNIGKLGKFQGILKLPYITNLIIHTQERILLLMNCSIIIGCSILGLQAFSYAHSTTKYLFALLRCINNSVLVAKDFYIQLSRWGWCAKHVIKCVSYINTLQGGYLAKPNFKSLQDPFATHMQIRTVLL